MGDAAAAASAAFPLGAKVLAATLLSGYLLCAVVPSAADLLPLVPGKALPCVWMPLTSGFVELHILSASGHTAALLLLARLVEPRWGATELLRFAAVTAAGAGALTLAALFAAYVFTRSGGALYTHVAGGQALVAGLAVALKQAHGEAELAVGAGAARLRLKGRHAPAAALVPYVLLAAAGGGEAAARAVHAAAGAVAAWYYLRHHQRLVDGAPPGDPSPQFSAISFLPAALQSLAGGGSARQQSAASAPPPEGAPLPGSAPLDASRRRERGAKALEQRLAQAASKRSDDDGGTAPSNEDADAAV